jgi:hypothetical protein
MMPHFSNLKLTFLLSEGIFDGVIQRSCNYILSNGGMRNLLDEKGIDIGGKCATKRPEILHLIFQIMGSGGAAWP